MEIIKYLEMLKRTSLCFTLGNQRRLNELNRKSIKLKALCFHTGILLGFTALSFFLTIKVAFAYVVEPWKWPTNTVNYDAHLLNSQWVQAVDSARSAWNNVTPSPFAFNRNDTSANDLYMIGLTGSTIAQEFTYCGASLCSVAGSTVTRTVIEFDNSNRTWHLATDCMVPSNANDARGVITHELGHSATLKHSTCGSDPTTMCGTIPTGVDSCAWRSLHQDDINGLNAQYP